jgi:hypothetical protein
MAQRRPALPVAVEHDVIVRSRRRCCLCFGLNFDTSYKRIQIAHLDHNRANNKTDNLAALCQVHHDEYDSRPSQTKGLTAGEVKHHRAQLYRTLEQQHGELTFQQDDDGVSGQKRSSVTSSHLLGQVLSAFDTDFKAYENNGSSNGIKLARLAEIAATEEGDFAVAIEAFTSLLRLAAKYSERQGIHISDFNFPQANPRTQAVRVLKSFAKLDHGLMYSALKATGRIGLTGNIPIEEVSGFSVIPHESFASNIAILIYFCKDELPETKWAMDSVVLAIGQSLVALAISFKISGLRIPVHRGYRKNIDYNYNSIRKNHKDEDGDIDEYFSKLHFLRGCEYICLLREDLYQKSIRSIKFDPMISIEPNLEKGYDADEALRWIALSAVVYTYTFGYCEVKTEKDKEACISYLEDLKVQGTDAINELRDYLRIERGLRIGTIEPRFPPEIQKAYDEQQLAKRSGKV